MNWNNDIMNNLIVEFNNTADVKIHNIIIKELYNLSWMIMNHKRPKTYLIWEDMVQNSVAVAASKLHLFNPEKGSSYSYFYRALLTSFLYDIRAFNRKNNKNVSIEKMNNNIEYTETEHLDVSDIISRAHESIDGYYCFYNKRAHDNLIKLEQDLIQNNVDIPRIDSQLRKILMKNRDYIRWNK